MGEGDVATALSNGGHNVEVHASAAAGAGGTSSHDISTGKRCHSGSKHAPADVPLHEFQLLFVLRFI